jgi:hypothetical protein
MNNFEFTFKTISEYISARITGYIPEYKCVRVEVSAPNGSIFDFPLHSEQEYYEYVSKNLSKSGNKLIKVYQSVTFYESEYYY